MRDVLDYQVRGFTGVVFHTAIELDGYEPHPVVLTAAGKPAQPGDKPKEM